MSTSKSDTFESFAKTNGRVVHPLPRATRPSQVHKVAFGVGGAKHAKPLSERKENLVLPGLGSWNPTLISFQRKLSEAINDHLKPDLNSELMSANGVISDANKLRAVSGYEQTPVSAVAIDSSVKRKELGLSEDYTPRHKEIAEAFWRLAFSEYHASAINVPKKSTWGARRFTTDDTLKLLYAKWLYRPDVFERMLTTFASGDMVGLCDNFEMVLMFYLQKRAQIDAPGKVRLAADIEYMISRGKRGVSAPTDNRVVLNGVLLDDFAGMRVRTVQAGPWPVNLVNALVGKGTLNGLFARFPNTFHVNTPEQIEAVLRGKRTYFADVKEYDSTMSKLDIETPFKCAAEFWDERIIGFCRRHMVSPYYARPLDLDGKRGRWVGDPGTLDDELFGGNRSGHWWTALLAKGNKVIEELVILDDCGIDVVEHMIPILEHKAPIVIVNNGDDVVVAGDGPIFDMYLAARERGDGFYKVEREVGCVFSGWVVTDPNANREYIAVPKINTAFERMYVPERAIGGMLRPYWPIGFFDRINAPRPTRAHEDAWELHNKTYYDLLRPKIGSLVSVLTTASEAGVFRYAGTTAKDREVLEDPDKMHYKFTENEISADVLASISGSVPKVLVEPLVAKYFRGTTHDYH